MNLLSNAFKYTRQGSVELDITYRSEVARFTVRDTGVGIARADQERIFEPFERVHDATLPVVGTGLGLAISNLLAEIMGGRILLTSERGKGSEFTLQILLPSAIGVYKNPRPGIKLKQLSQQKTIMVVDDEPSHRQLIDNLLTPAGFAVLQAHTAEEAGALANTHSIDLYILDVNLPGMNGWAFLSALREDGNQSPVIMLSAEPYETEDVQRLKGQFDAYLNKPVEFDRLIGQIERLLEISLQEEDEESLDDEGHDETISDDTIVDLQEMREYAKLGYLKGLTECAAKLEERYQSTFWFSHLTLLVESCDLDSIVRAIDKLFSSQSVQADEPSLRKRSSDSAD